MRSDKLRAVELMEEQWRRLMEETQKFPLPNPLAQIVSSPPARRDLAYCTYGHWLIERMKGRTDGPAVLALWREIAYTAAGSPIRGFRLLIDDFVSAESRLRGWMEQ